MPGAQVATLDYAPGGWSVGTRMIVRRANGKAGDMSTAVRARRRRTFDPAQLALALGGQIGHAYAYSPIVTNLTGSAVAIEAWFRDRAWVEERIKDSKLGMALRHLPSGYAAANEVWMWAAFLALSLSAALQALTGHDQPHRAHGKRLRRELITVPARVVHHARRLIVRHATGTTQTGPEAARKPLPLDRPCPSGHQHADPCSVAVPSSRAHAQPRGTPCPSPLKTITTAQDQATTRGSRSDSLWGLAWQGGRRRGAGTARPPTRQGRCASLRDRLRRPLTRGSLPVLGKGNCGQGGALPADRAPPPRPGWLLTQRRLPEPVKRTP